MSARIAQLADATSLIDLKLEFLCITCSHEHYVTLNLPFSLVLTPSAPSSPCPSIASSTSQTSYASTGTMIEKVRTKEGGTERQSEQFSNKKNAILCGGRL